MKKRSKEYLLLLSFMILVSCLIVVFLHDIPISAHPSAKADDGLMLDWAKNIVQGRWLGNYNWLTHCKGPALSIVLALCHVTNISFIIFEAVLYEIGVILLSLSFYSLTKNKWFVCFQYILLAVNPIAFTRGTFQVTYRCGLALGISLIIFSFYIKIYSSEKTTIIDLLWSILSSVVTPIMLFSREDSIWILLFMIVATVCIIFRGKRNRTKKTNIFKKMILCSLPLFAIICVTIRLSSLNVQYYGIKCVTDSSNTSFSRCISLIFTIEDDSKLQRVFVSKKKLQKLYENSPTLRQLEHLDDQIAAWTQLGRNPECNEIEGTLFYWALRNAVEEDGYYTNGDKSEEFYENVYKELNQAVKEGILNKTWSMPSVFLMPWRAEYLPIYLEQLWETTKYIFSYKELEVYGSDMPYYGEPDEDNLEVALFCNTYGINIVTLQNEGYINVIDKKVNILRKVISTFQFFNPILFYISFIFGFVFCTIRIFTRRNNWSRSDNSRNTITNEIILVMLGLFACFLLIVIGVSYVEITDYEAIKYRYLSPAYNILLILECCCIYIGEREMTQLIKRRKHSSLLKSN